MRKDRVCMLVLFVLACVSPCLAQAGPGNQPNTAKIKPPQATPKPASAGENKKSAKPRSMSASADDIEARERQVLESIKKGDLQAFGNMLAEDATEATGHGVISKAQIIEELKGGTIVEYTMSDAKVMPIDKDASLLTYRISGKFSMRGQEMPFNDMASTVWVKRNGKWLAFFHQETPVMEGHQ